MIKPRISLHRLVGPSVVRPYASIAERGSTVNARQKLYYLDPHSPGSVFFLPAGTSIFSRLVAFVRAQMRYVGFDEVVSPQLYKKELWETSGHWQHYSQDMFGVTDGHEEPLEVSYSLKPMNCPGHCLIYKSQKHSYRDLPIRYAEFSPLHRNEASGALTGLTRVRRFHQDDGHIFCRPDQVKQEILASIALIGSVYRVFGLEYKMLLSTRPDDYIGEISDWNTAEHALESAIKESGHEVTINEKDGAFYGPKIDFVVTDGSGKSHQAATVQLDFQLPHNFELKYDTEDAVQQPIMIHRAVFGSFERFMALLIDHYDGKWPCWLNPRQVIVLPVSDRHLEYATAITKKLQGKGDGALMSKPQPVVDDNVFSAELFGQNEPLSGRLRHAADLSPNFIVVVGDKEMETNTISVRPRGQRKSSSMSFDELTELLKEKVNAFE